MANFDDIQNRIYSLKEKNVLNEEVITMDIINHDLYNESNLINTISKISPQQINSNNLLERVLDVTIKSSIPIEEQKQLGNIFIRLLPRIEGIKKYKEKINEVADKLNNPYIKDNLKILIECDRIINNQEKLNQYSNFTYIFENYFINNDIETIVIESCDIIDSYKMKYETKLNVALENIIYNMDSIKAEYDKKELVELVYEYFCVNKNYKKENVEKILNESSINMNQASIKAILEGKATNKIKQNFKDLYRSNSVTKEALEQTIHKVYVDSGPNIIEDLPNLLGCVRLALILGIASWNLPLGIIIGIADHVISLKLNRVDIEKSIKYYKKEKTKIENKKYSVSNPATIKKYDQLDKEYDKSIEKLEIYRDKLYTEKENDDRLMSEGADEDVIRMVAEFTTLCTTIESFCENNDIQSKLYDYIATIDDTKEIKQLFESLSESAVVSRDILSIDNLYKKLDCPNIAGSLINSISKFKRTPVPDEEDIDIFDEMVYYNDIYDILSENSFTAKAKLLAIKANNKVESLTDKETLISRKIDSTFDRMRDELNTKTTNQNREAVIKGTILPSLSALIKMVLGSYLVGVAVTPLLGVIGFVAGIALSKKATDKERENILGEIDIQLELVEKKISLAENNNDMKSLEQLLRIQRKLKQEKQRIIYHGSAKNYYIQKHKD